MAQLDDPRIVRYHSTWTEKPPTGWQVTQISDAKSNGSLQHNSDENTITILLQSKKNEKVDLLKMVRQYNGAVFSNIHKNEQSLFYR